MRDTAPSVQNCTAPDDSARKPALPAGRGTLDYTWHGFEYHSDFRKAGPTDRNVRQVWFPHWSLAIIGVIPPIALFLRGARRRSRLRHGLCATCGVNRNETTCDCATEVRDPRWAALDDLRLDE